MILGEKNSQSARMLGTKIIRHFFIAASNYFKLCLCHSKGGGAVTISYKLFLTFWWFPKIPIPYLSLCLNSENEKVRIWARLFHGVARYEDHLLHLIHMGKENLVLLSFPLHHQNCCPRIQGQNYPQTPHKKLTSVRR